MHFMGSIQRVVNATGVTPLVIHHFNKGTGRAGQLVAGSAAWRDASRSLITFAMDEETGKRVITVDKINGAKAGMSLEFDLEAVPVPDGEGWLQSGNGERVYAVRAGDLSISETTVQKIIDAQANGDDQQDAVTTLEQLLMEGNGQARAKVAMKAMREEGFTDKQTRAAMKKLGCVIERIGFGKDGYSVWTLPSPCDHTEDEYPSDHTSPIMPIDSLPGEGQVWEPMGKYDEPSNEEATTPGLPSLERATGRDSEQVPCRMKKTKATGFDFSLALNQADENYRNLHAVEGCDK